MLIRLVHCYEKSFFLGQSRPLFLFIFVFSTRYNLNSNWKKIRWCAWDSNPGQHGGRRKRIHWAMGAPHAMKNLDLNGDRTIRVATMTIVFKKRLLKISVTRLGDLLNFGQVFKALGKINLAKSPTFLINFCKGVKMYPFSCEIILR